MTEEERWVSIILYAVDDDGMFVCGDIRRSCARKYLEKYPDAQGEVGNKARRLLGLSFSPNSEQVSIEEAA